MNLSQLPASGTPVQPTDAVEAIYRARCVPFAQQRDAYEQRWNRVANLRLLLFLAAIACAGFGFWLGLPVLYGLAGLLATAFVASVVYHTALGRQRRRYDALWAINNEGLQRLRRDWAALPLRQPPAVAATPSYATDLDLLGHASLQHLLNTAYTPVGQATVRNWLLQPAAPETVRQRQAAVAELSSLIDFRDEISLRGRLMGDAQADYERFLDWAEAPPWLLAQPWLVWTSRVLAVFTLGTLFAQLVGLLVVPIWLVGFALNLVVIFIVRTKASDLIEQAGVGQAIYRSYGELFDLINAQHFAAVTLVDLQTHLSAGELRAGEQMRRLGRIMAFVDLRLSPFYAPFYLLGLADLHVLWLLERWKRVAGIHVRAWLLALGELEALNALATLAHDHPAWSFPTIIEEQSPRVTGRALGHPLLAPAACVTNDITLGPPGTFLLVTGSNMSGKSTLLRSLGINVVLAQAGGPVCAAQLDLPPLELATSMRVQDSLEQGVSYFMAELQRLKEVVDAAERVRAQGKATLLFLLDEILQGTNTAERQIAARQIIRYLIEQNALGAVSTHDLGLADAPELASAREAVHFSETFVPSADGSMMEFDYRLRSGVATSTNALALVRQVLGDRV